MKLDSKLQTVFVVVCIVILIIFFAFGLRMVEAGGASLVQLAVALGILLIANALALSISRSEIRNLGISAAEQAAHASFGTQDTILDSRTQEDRKERLSVENKESEEIVDNLAQPRPIRNERVRE